MGAWFSKKEAGPVFKKLGGPARAAFKLRISFQSQVDSKDKYGFQVSTEYHYKDGQKISTPTVHDVHFLHRGSNAWISVACAKCMHAGVFIENVTLSGQHYQYCLIHLVPHTNDNPRPAAVVLDADNDLEKLVSILKGWSAPGEVDPTVLEGQRTPVDPDKTPLSLFTQEVLNMVTKQSGEVKTFDMPQGNHLESEIRALLLHDFVLGDEFSGLDYVPCIAPLLFHGGRANAEARMSAWGTINCKRFSNIMSFYFGIPMPERFNEVQREVQAGRTFV